MANILFSVFILLKIGSLRTCWRDQRDHIQTTVFDPFFNLLMLLVPAGTSGNLLWSGWKISSSVSVSGTLFLRLGIWLAETTPFSKTNTTICQRADHTPPASLFPFPTLQLSPGCDDPIIEQITLLSAVQEDHLPTKHCHQDVGTPFREWRSLPAREILPIKSSSCKS